MRFPLLISLLIGALLTSAQPTKKIKKSTPLGKEIYFVLKSDQQTKNGTYQLIGPNKVILMNGVYKDGIRIGRWTVNLPGKPDSTIYYQGGEMVRLDMRVRDTLIRKDFDQGIPYLISKQSGGYTILRTYDEEENITSSTTTHYKITEQVTYKGDSAFYSLIHDNQDTLEQGWKVHGKRQGQWHGTAWNGCQHERQYSAGTKVGTHRSYYPNGAALIVKHYNDSGQLQGIYQKFYMDGTTMVSIQYDSGTKVGEAYANYPNGTPYIRALFASGRLMSYTTYDMDGELLQGQVVDGNGTYRTYSYDMGDSSINTDNYQEFPIENGYVHGRVTSTFKGKTKKVQTFRHGILLDEHGNPESGDTASILLGHFGLSNDLLEGMPDLESSNLRRILAQSLEYPNAAIESEVQGMVLIRFVVNHKGQYEDMEILSKPLGFGLEEAAMEALKATEGVIPPGNGDGFPAKIRFQIPINFQLY